MRKFVFFSLPAQGHTNPTLNIAQELHNKGHRVIYYSTEEFKKQIENTGVIFRSYPFHLAYDKAISRHVGKVSKKLIDQTKQELPQLLTIIEKEKPDCLVHDAVALSGKIIAHKLKIPAVSLITTPAFHNDIIKKYPRIFLKLFSTGFLTDKEGMIALYEYTQLLKKYKLKAGFDDLLMNKEELNIIFTSSYFHPCADSFGDDYKFVGPSLMPKKGQDEFLQKLKKNKKTIYISLGTVVNDNIALYRLLINTFANTPYQVILSLGNRFTLADIGKIPDNIIIKRYLNQLKVLQSTDIFITHAGMNGVNESLYYGVPMILIPDTEEQKIIALRTQELGAGIYFDRKDITEATLLKKTEHILQTKSYYAKAKEVQKTLRDSGGYKKAVQAILEYLSKVL